jgi:hypothetical protein
LYMYVYVCIHIHTQVLQEHQTTRSVSSFNGRGHFSVKPPCLDSLWTTEECQKRPSIEANET